MSFLRLTTIPSTPQMVKSVFGLGILLTLLNFYVLRISQTSRSSNDNIMIDDDNRQLTIEKGHPKPIAWINGPHANSGYLDNVIRMFRNFGYHTIIGGGRKVNNFDILWHHEYPFSKPEMKSYLENMKPPHPKFNHVPGSGYYTNKVSLATASNITGVPIAFVLPQGRSAFEHYAKLNPNLQWVQKDNNHRKIRIREFKDLNLDQANSFVQQYIADPLLIDGRKFDIGIYTVITSIAPLRVYVYEGDILLRFCTKSYLPFDAEAVDQYVVGDDYTPTWQMPSLRKYYINQNLTFRETLNAYLRDAGKDPTKIYDAVRETIRQVFRSQQSRMIRSASNFKATSASFFELSRFDFVVDKALNVFLMEANMSPNLSSEHFANNRLLYDQVLLNTLSLVGSTRILHDDDDDKTRQTEASIRDLMVAGQECERQCRGTAGCKLGPMCMLCSHCMTTATREMLRSAYREHMDRRSMRRVLPPAISDDESADDHRDQRRSRLTAGDRLLEMWFEGKCRQDMSWCM